LEIQSPTLFDDGVPATPLGYRGTSAAAAAGISYRQLDYWDRTALVVPSIQGAAGSGSQRLYSFRDILVLKLVKRLLDTGVSLQQIRVAVEQLKAAGIADLANTTLMSDGARVYLCTTQDEVIDLLGQGQGVFGIAVGRLVREVEATLIDFAAEEAQIQDELAELGRFPRPPALFLGLFLYFLNLNNFIQCTAAHGAVNHTNPGPIFTGLFQLADGSC
jgi:DNA-binding transcriptional MerR regulator